MIVYISGRVVGSVLRLRPLLLLVLLVVQPAGAQDVYDRHPGAVGSVANPAQSVLAGPRDVGTSFGGGSAGTAFVRPDASGWSAEQPPGVLHPNAAFQNTNLTPVQVYQPATDGQVYSPRIDSGGALPAQQAQSVVNLSQRYCVYDLVAKSCISYSPSPCTQSDEVVAAPIGSSSNRK